jgi:5-methylcytosine-specific restriction endonuclease McrA
VAEPFPKSRQLARGERRYRRKVASPKQWAAIRAEKLGPCRVCGFTDERLIQLHHLVSRAQGGDDVAANLVPLGWQCHKHVTERDGDTLRRLAEALTDAEYAYVVSKLGESAMQRLFGV